MDIAEVAEGVARTMAQSGAGTLGSKIAAGAVDGVRGLYGMLRRRFSDDPAALRTLDLTRQTADLESVEKLAAVLATQSREDPVFAHELEQALESIRRADPTFFAVYIAGEARVGKVINIDAPHGRIDIG